MWHFTLLRLLMKLYGKSLVSFRYKNSHGCLADELKKKSIFPKLTAPVSLAVRNRPPCRWLGLTSKMSRDCCDAATTRGLQPDLFRQGNIVYIHRLQSTQHNHVCITAARYHGDTVVQAQGNPRLWRSVTRSISSNTVGLQVDILVTNKAPVIRILLAMAGQ